MTTEITESWYNQLIEDCKDLITEVEFTSRWTLVEGYHSLGSRILQENENFERAKIYGQGICNAVAISLGKKERTVYYAIEFARKYPDLALLKEGKNISWHHVINKYLTNGKDKATKKPSPATVIQEIKKLLEIEVQKARQLEVSFLERPEAKVYADRITFIRYLQDQVNKIIGNL